MQNDDDETNPSWLHEDNDGSHKGETSPLLGSGPIDLQGEDKPSSPRQPESKYGSAQSDRDVESANTKKDDDPFAMKEPVEATQKDKQDPTKFKPELPRPNVLLATFFFLEGCGILTSLALMATQLIPVFLFTPTELGILSFLLKTYVCLFCILFVAVESDAPLPFLRNASFLQSFLSRGFLYSFLGLSSIEEAYSERVKNMLSHAKDEFHVAWLALFIEVSAWVMIGLGATYMILGLCCMKRVRDNMKKDYQERWKTYRENMKIYRQHN